MSDQELSNKMRTPDPQRFMRTFTIGWVLIWAITQLVITWMRYSKFLDPLSFPSIPHIFRVQFVLQYLPALLPALLGSILIVICLQKFFGFRSGQQLGLIVLAWFAVGVFGPWLFRLLVSLLPIELLASRTMTSLVFLTEGAFVGAAGGYLTLLLISKDNPSYRRQMTATFILTWLGAFTLSILVYTLLFVQTFPIQHPTLGTVNLPGVDAFFYSNIGQGLLEALRPLDKLAFQRNLPVLRPANIIIILFMGVVCGLLSGLIGGRSLTAYYGREIPVGEAAEPALTDEEKLNREHSGCLRWFLILAVVANILIPLANWAMLAGDRDLQGYANLSGLVGLVAAGCAYATLKWKRWGVYGFVGAAVIGMLLTFAYGFTADALRTLLPIILLIALIRPSWKYMD